MAPTGGRPGEPLNEALTILVVDDQDDVRRCLRELLAALGHLVITVPCPTEAIAALEARSVSFDCAFIDVDLPIMSGARLAERAVGLVPGLRVVLMSGYQREDLEDEGLIHGHHAFLQKPFRIADLQKLLALVQEWRSSA